ncbi:phosphoesterase [Novosphingobium sp. PY1]|uniref:phosphoesterase n=1 Tax=Novosphingobium sp. PY1 TaxID=1882221 RepID=UPI001A8FBBDA|nr:phosphoesterase [Novosphingobium sp. PY1]GFM30548.1 PHP domain protein [Novosphingobium sp. PY1]
MRKGIFVSPLLAIAALILATAASGPQVSGVGASRKGGAREWLAGDHHVHSEFSAGWQLDPAHPDAPPKPVLGGDSRHTGLQNAQMARRFGLDWIVATDHGGPRHSELNYRIAWPVIEDVRKAVPDLIVFYGLEFDTPGGEHATLIMPRDPSERENLRRIEAGYAERDAWPADPSRDTKPRMLEALRMMEGLTPRPVLLANHPSRTATGLGLWGLHDPQEFRRWMDAAPHVAVGMEGIPGHQAAMPENGNDAAHGSRGLYGGYPTMGGFDQMTATLGGAWDAMLSEGLHWWITAGSDSHGHVSEGGADFWPGEYAKTWVHAQRDPADILDGLRKGRVFVSTGNLVTGVSLSVAGKPVELGSTTALPANVPAVLTIEVAGAAGEPGMAADDVLDHVDVIVGSVGAAGRTDTQVARRFSLSRARGKSGNVTLDYRIPDFTGKIYLRLRGTNTRQGEPDVDVPGEDPRADLWFYTNPIFLARE